MAGACYHVSSEVGDDVEQLRADPGFRLGDFCGLRGDRVEGSDVEPSLLRDGSAVGAGAHCGCGAQGHDLLRVGCDIPWFWRGGTYPGQRGQGFSPWKSRPSAHIFFGFGVYDFFQGGRECSP
eukprot:1400888-Pyramimonas_sp.AAC.1